LPLASPPHLEEFLARGLLSCVVEVRGTLDQKKIGGREAQSIAGRDQGAIVAIFAALGLWVKNSRPCSLYGGENMCHYTLGGIVMES
jgi:hypothetical protein